MNDFSDPNQFSLSGITKRSIPLDFSHLPFFVLHFPTHLPIALSKQIERKVRENQQRIAFLWNVLRQNENAFSFYGVRPFYLI